MLDMHDRKLVGKARNTSHRLVWRSFTTKIGIMTKE